MTMRQLWMASMMAGAAMLGSCARYQEPSRGDEAILVNHRHGFVEMLSMTKLVTRIEKIDNVRATGIFLSYRSKSSA